MSSDNEHHDELTMPIVIAHREWFEGPPARGGAWYLHGIFDSTGDIEIPDFEEEHTVAYDAVGRLLRIETVGGRATPRASVASVDPQHVVDLECILRRHLEGMAHPGAHDPSLSPATMIEEANRRSRPLGWRGKLAVLALLAALVVPWIVGMGAISGWAWGQSGSGHESCTKVTASACS